MRFTKGTAMYTGGGIYVVLGETDNGLYFLGNCDCVDIYNADVREEDENGDMACFYPEWEELHRVETSEDLVEPFKNFCRRLDAKEEGITEGWEAFSNYAAGEVYDYMDFEDDIEIKYLTNYSSEADRTFIIERTYINNKLSSEEVVGFYSGEPNEEDTKLFTHKTKAIYEL